MLLSLDVHVVQKVMWAGIHNDWRACRTPSNNRENAGRLMLGILEIGSSKLDLETLETLETVPGVLQQPCNWHFLQGERRDRASLAGLRGSWANQRALCFYLKSETGMAKEAVAGN